MYEQKISRLTPGCIVFLVDRSDSMRRPWPNGRTLADGAATAVNRTLTNLATMSTPSGTRIRHYFDIGVVGYGQCADGREGVESALGGSLAGRALVPIPELAASPLREEEVPSPDREGPVIKEPVWVEPRAGEKTPMCEAIALAGSYIHQWVADHRSSFPPIVINITDGQVTDRYGDTPLHEWADRLCQLETDDGRTILFNIFLGPDDGDPPVMFPSTPDGLPTPGPDLFAMSSPLPEPFVDVALSRGMTVPDGGRAFSFNADFPALQRFLLVGTDVRLRGVG